MWNTFSALYSGFKIYKEKYLAAVTKPKKHLKGSQPRMLHGERLDLLSLAHKEGP